MNQKVIQVVLFLKFHIFYSYIESHLLAISFMKLERKKVKQVKIRLRYKMKLKWKITVLQCLREELWDREVR